MTVKIFTELTFFGATATRNQLRERVMALEDAGSSGVSVWDHIFTSDGEPAPCDPLTTLAAVGALSDTLELQSIVVNAAWLHPGLLLRQYHQLAVHVGGDRVTAGLGAGWSFEEFRAMGMPFPSFRERIERLEEVFKIATEMYAHGSANVDGRYFQAYDLPLIPTPKTRPNLLVGGGGDRTLSIAAQYADPGDHSGEPGLSRVLQGSRTPSPMSTAMGLNAEPASPPKSASLNTVAQSRDWS